MRAAHLPLLLLLLGCPSPSPVPASSVPASSAPAATGPEERASERVPPSALAGRDESCLLPAAAPTLKLASGGSHTVESGLTVRYLGTRHDHYDDGRFEVVATLEFRRGAEHERREWSALAPSTPSQLFGHCVRLLSTGADGAVLRLAPLTLAAPRIRHLSDGRCEPTPREHSPCSDGEGYCLLSWGQPGGWSSALWCRGGRWTHENERNLER